MRVCQIGGRFSKCKEAAAHSCQYCGRLFCATHAYFVYDHEAVCTRENCRAKRDDMVVHDAYKQRVSERNRAGLCGVEDCGPHPGHQCSLCQGMYCPKHVTQHMYPFFDGFARIERPTSVCPRCWDRRKIWRKVR